MKKYLPTIQFYILYFFLLSLFGWIWEVCIYFFMEQQFINRGTLTGPWLPIYGAGSVLLTLFLLRIKKHPIIIFFSSLLLCSILEYMTSWALEAAWGIRWWDYDTHFLNINGRICLFGSIGFGIGGLLLIYLVHPALKKQYARIPGRLRTALCLLLLFLFIPDCIGALFSPQTGEGITYTSIGFRSLLIQKYHKLL